MAPHAYRWAEAWEFSHEDMRRNGAIELGRVFEEEIRLFTGCVEKKGLGI
jgi:hypothetical protein